MIVRHYWNCVFGLHHVTVWRIVNQNNLAKLTTCHSQVLQIVPLLQSAMLPVEAMGDIFFFWVQIVKDNVRI